MYQEWGEEECILVGKPDGKIPLGRPKRRWEDCIKLVLENQDGEVWNGFISLMIGRRGCHL
jgi:hypothetical protein